MIEAVTVSALWGITNPFLRLATASTPSSSVRDLARLAINWRFVLPFLLNQSASVVFFFFGKREREDNRCSSLFYSPINSSAWSCRPSTPSPCSSRHSPELLSANPSRLLLCSSDLFSWSSVSLVPLSTVNEEKREDLDSNQKGEDPDSNQKRKDPNSNQSRSRHDSFLSVPLIWSHCVEGESRCSGRIFVIESLVMVMARRVNSLHPLLIIQNWWVDRCLVPLVKARVVFP